MPTIESVEEIPTSQEEIPPDQIPQIEEEEVYDAINQDLAPINKPTPEEPDEYVEIEGVDQPKVVLNSQRANKPDSVRYQKSPSEKEVEQQIIDEEPNI